VRFNAGELLTVAMNLVALALVVGEAGGSSHGATLPRKIYTGREVEELHTVTMCGYAKDACSACVKQFGRGQHGEDRVLLRNLLLASEMRPGTFLEIGAMDGDSFSNTLMLERCYNWTGLLVEADPGNFARLNQSNRQAAMMHAAACEHVGGTIPFLMNKHRDREKGFSPVSVQLDAVSHGFKERFLTDSKATEIVHVACMPLKRMMRQAGFDAGMTFLSLDVEGAEDKVLATVDPSLFTVVLVEWAPEGSLVDATNTSKNGRVHERLVAAGMVLHETLTLGRATLGGHNRVYLHPSLATHPLLMTHNKAKYMGPCLKGVEARARREHAVEESPHTTNTKLSHSAVDDHSDHFVSLHCAGSRG